MNGCISNPTVIANLSEAKSITVSKKHTLALMKNGTVKAWRSNNLGKLVFDNANIAVKVMTIKN